MSTNDNKDFVDMFDDAAEQLIREHTSLSSSGATKSLLQTPLKPQSPLDSVTAHIHQNPELVCREY